MTALLASGGALSHAEPASASQRRTWFMELVAPGIPQHHLPFALEIFGTSTLQRSSSALIY